MLVAQMLGGYSLIQLAIFVIVIAGIIGVVFVVTRQMGVTIPPWIITILWIVLAVIIGVIAIRFLATML